VTSQSQLGYWWLAIRPKTLSLSVTPVLVALALAWESTGHIASGPGVAALIVALLIQIATNLHNDAADFERGTDTPDRLGPPRATAEGWLNAGAVKRAAYGCLLVAFLVGLYLASIGGWPILLLGLSALAAAYGYSGTSRPIASGPTGEIFVFLFFGIAAVAGTFYLQVLEWSPRSIRFGAALGLIAAAVLLVNNYRDMRSDACAGRKTLPLSLGRTRTFLAYGMMMLIPFPLVALGPTGIPDHELKSVWLALPVSLLLIWRFVRTPPGPTLNKLLARTALFQLLFGALIIVGLLW
jgi:1,4-dihydroxy-2-naphthoate octaprenyltransferase